MPVWHDYCGLLAQEGLRYYCCVAPYSIIVQIDLHFGNHDG